MDLNRVTDTNWTQTGSRTPNSSKSGRPPDRDKSLIRINRQTDLSLALLTVLVWSIAPVLVRSSRSNVTDRLVMHQRDLPDPVGEKVCTHDWFQWTMALCIWQIPGRYFKRYHAYFSNNSIKIHEIRIDIASWYNMVIHVVMGTRTNLWVDSLHG